VAEYFSSASCPLGAVLLLAIAVASLATVGVGWIGSLAEFSEDWVNIFSCVTWGVVLVAFFSAESRWRRADSTAERKQQQCSCNRGRVLTAYATASLT
jgi:hypothetical protein